MHDIFGVIAMDTTDIKVPKKLSSAEIALQKKLEGAQARLGDKLIKKYGTYIDKDGNGELDADEIKSFITEKYNANTKKDTDV